MDSEREEFNPGTVVPEVEPSKEDRIAQLLKKNKELEAKVEVLHRRAVAAATERDRYNQKLKYEQESAEQLGQTNSRLRAMNKSQDELLQLMRAVSLEREESKPDWPNGAHSLSVIGGGTEAHVSVGEMGMTLILEINGQEVDRSTVRWRDEVGRLRTPEVTP